VLKSELISEKLVCHAKRVRRQDSLGDLWAPRELVFSNRTSLGTKLECGRTWTSKSHSAFAGCACEDDPSNMFARKTKISWWSAQKETSVCVASTRQHHWIGSVDARRNRFASKTKVHIQSALQKSNKNHACANHKQCTFLENTIMQNTRKYDGNHSKKDHNHTRTPHTHTQTTHTWHTQTQRTQYTHNLQLTQHTYKHTTQTHKHTNSQTHKNTKHKHRHAHTAAHKQTTTTRYYSTANSRRGVHATDSKDVARQGKWCRTHVEFKPVLQYVAVPSIVDKTIRQKNLLHRIFWGDILRFCLGPSEPWYSNALYISSSENNLNGSTITDRSHAHIIDRLMYLRTSEPLLSSTGM